MPYGPTQTPSAGAPTAGGGFDANMAMQMVQLMQGQQGPGQQQLLQQLAAMGPPPMLPQAQPQAGPTIGQAMLPAMSPQALMAPPKMTRGAAATSPGTGGLGAALGGY